MAASFLSVPLKKATDCDLSDPLNKFIRNSYATSDTHEDYSRQLSELQHLREKATRIDRSEKTLENLQKYYDQLVALEGKFPLTENQVRIPFKWKDAFDKGSMFTGKLSLTVSSGSYERACLLFNMAAIMSQLGAEMSPGSDSDDGLKASAKYFQQSAGIFGYLKDNVLSMIQQDPTPDLCPDTLHALQALMLAQAQEAFVRKAMNDQMKDHIIAKITMQCCDFYAEALKLLQLPTIRSFWEKEWIPSVAGKQAFHHGMAEYYQSKLCKASKTVGEELARLQKSEELLRTAQSRASDNLNFVDAIAMVTRDHVAAKKDNDFIYHERIPEYRNLTGIGKAALAKPTPIPAQFSDKFSDLFAKLVPIAVQQATAAFETRKGEVVNSEIGRLREQTTTLNALLASLNLPAAIEDLGGAGGAQLPASLREKAAAVRAKGGARALNSSMTELPELLERNREILEEAVRLLDEEQSSDNELRDKFGEKWTRTASDKLTAPLRQEADKYRQILFNAVNADKIVKEKYASHKDGINLLSLSESELTEAIPSADPGSTLQGRGEVAELKKYMEEVDTLKAERDVVESELKDATSNMQVKFLSALAKDGAIQEEALSVECLGQTYGPLQQQVQDSIQRQSRLVENIRRANDAFSAAKAAGGNPAAHRDEKLKQLAAAHDMFVELLANLQEGTKFYNDLTPLLVKFQSKCSDLVFARKTEKEDLVKDIQSSIANRPAGNAPQAPAHHKQTPPARPPPPAAAVAAPTAGPTAPQPTQPPYQPQYTPPAMPQVPAYNPYIQPPPMSFPAMPQGQGYNPYQQPPPGAYPQQQQPYPGYPAAPTGYPQQPQQGGYPRQPGWQ